MSVKPENDDDPFILVLGTSPSNSIRVEEYVPSENGDKFVKLHLEDAMKDLSIEVNDAFKAHFSLANSPSPASIMVASALITDEKTTPELQKRFGEIIDENVILKETLRQNNEAMKEQFVLITACQEDMKRSHKVHEDNLNETRDMLNKLRQENVQLKLEVTRISENGQSKLNTENGDEKMVMSAVEFVSSPDDDTINKLTAQLELVEKQRRDVIVENERLTWQKESLQRVADGLTKDMADAEKKIKELELNILNKDCELAKEIGKLNYIINDMNLKKVNSGLEELKKRDLETQQLQTKVTMLQNDLRTAQLKIDDLEHMKLQLLHNEELFAKERNNLKSSIDDLWKKLQIAQKSRHSTEEIEKERERKDAVIVALQAEITGMQHELKRAEIRIKDLEHIKMEFTQHKTNVAEMVNVHKEQVQELQQKIKQMQYTLLQPVEIPELASIDSDSAQAEYHAYSKSVKLYNRTLRHMTNCLNGLVEGVTDGLTHSLALTSSLCDFKLDRTSAEQLSSGLVSLKNRLSKHHSAAVDKLCLVRGCLSMFEEIFNDYNELLKKNLAKTDNPQNIPQLTAALVARGDELNALRAQVEQLSGFKADCEVLRAQLDVYKGDFDAERESREKMASEKESATTELRGAQKRVLELSAQLEEVRKLNPPLHKNVTRKNAVTGAAPSGNKTPATGPMVYSCPKCMRYSSTQYDDMENHFDFCLNDF